MMRSKSDRRLLFLAAAVAVGAFSGQTRPRPAAPVPAELRRVVRTTEQFRQAVAHAVPGSRILLGPGVYQGDNTFSGPQGTADRPILIAAADPRNKPIIRGGSECLKFSDPSYVELRDLVLEDSSTNALNIDDGGTGETPAHHIILRGLVVRRSGYNGIKLSGVDRFLVKDVLVEKWPDNIACGLDLVGCHDGVIESLVCRNTDRAGFGIQMKGGSSGIKVRGSLFDHAGWRAVQIGGTTGMQFFRPAPQGYEAKDIVVEYNLFIGSEAAVTFVGVDGAVVRFNTVYRPRGWVMRILQETVRDDFVPSRNGIFEDNIVTFRSDEVSTAVNVGVKTAPETFRFARNWWYCLDHPDRSRPELPTPELDGHAGIDPQFVDAERGDMRLRPGSPTAIAGAWAQRSGGDKQNP